MGKGKRLDLRKLGNMVRNQPSPVKYSMQTCGKSQPQPKKQIPRRA